MGSHSVTCHPTEVRILLLPPAEAGARFSDPGGMQLMQGLVDLCYVKATGRELNPATCKSQVQRPTAEQPRNTCNVISFITQCTRFIHVESLLYLTRIVYSSCRTSWITLLSWKKIITACTLVHIRRSLTSGMTRTVACALVNSRLDYANAGYTTRLRRTLRNISVLGTL